MKKRNLTIIILLLLIISGCAGYEPIFGSKNLQFKISSYSIEGDKNLGNKIYYKLNNISKKSKSDENTKIIDLKINISKEKVATSKNSAGKILEYKIILSSIINITDALTDEILLYESSDISTSYKSEDQYSETVSSESNSIENLLNTMYQKLLINLTQSII
jgi:hypothetical protein